eukprot:TRINITY_DN22976_c0_g1_i1.p1 TRINITY_DN22976_c0_g1~~TRINITY_DN22976_c0_g1_i1.p1  ORF type:complete len:429 (+),score=171.62 TRINITY_DN22976_c0_g1_i1:25-1287(+)
MAVPMDPRHRGIAGSAHKAELMKLASMGEDNPDTPWVRCGLASLARGKQFLDEENGQCISDTVWDEWEALTAKAAEQDPRRNWREGEVEWYSPRGVKSLRYAKPPVFAWKALNGEEEDGAFVVANKRTLSLAQLEEIISHVVESKAEWDKRYSNTAVPKQTMHHHMRSWLEKAALQNNASTETIMRRTEHAIQIYKKKSNAVAVFDAILRNEIEEEFRMVQQHLKRRIHQLLTHHVDMLSNSTAMKERLLAERVNSLVHQDEWEDIIRELYKGNDVLVLIRRCLDKIASYAPARRRIGPISVPNPCAHPAMIKYTHFVNTCLAFQLETHAAYLRKYVQLFRALDTDDDGMLTEDQFVRITQIISPQISREMSHALLDIADVGGSGTVTFSDSVNVLHRQLKVWLHKAQHDSSFAKTLALL